MMPEGRSFTVVDVGCQYFSKCGEREAIFKRARDGDADAVEFYYEGCLGGPVKSSCKRYREFVFEEKK